MRLFLALLWSVLGSTSSTAVGNAIAAPPAPQDSVVEAFTCNNYIHGVPYVAANGLGSAAVPHLRRILQDENSKSCWVNAICVISAIGSPESFAILQSFVWNRFRGEVDEPTYRALEAATLTIGYTCTSQPGLVIDYLERGANPQRWDSLPWHFTGIEPAELRDSFSNFCIYGLSYCSDPKARSILLNLLDKPYAKGKSARIQSALKTQEKVSAQGLYEYKRSGWKKK